MTTRRVFGMVVFAALCWATPERGAAVERQLGAGIPKPALTGAPWSPAARAGLARDLDALLDGAATFRGAHVGLLVIDTRSGEPLYARNADDAFMPGSTMKLLTGSAALALLGPGYRFHTEAYSAPPDTTLFIRAGGDPLLSAADIAAMSRAVDASTATHIAIDTSAFERAPYPPGWSWDDFVYDYAPKLSPLLVDENAVQLTISPGPNVGDPVRIAASVRDPRQIIASEATTGKPGSAMTLDVARDPTSKGLAIAGSLPVGAAPETLGVAMSDPASVVASLVAPPARSLPDTGYTFAQVPPDARLVWSHDGEPLTDELADMWWPSDNLIAEMLLRAIGLQHAGMPGTTEHGAAAERDWLTGIGVDPTSVTIADGSGLSSYDRLTPRALGAILQADWNSPFRDTVLDDLPLAGVRGTLARSFIGSLAERRTFAKTGSVNHTRGLAGYLATLHHGALTFAWSVDDWMGDDADLRALRARVLSRLIGD